MREPTTVALPIHPRALAALPPALWGEILTAAPEGEMADRGEETEILNWERAVDRGVLHDPPEQWYAIPRATYFAWRARWLDRARVPWPRRREMLVAWAERAAMRAYAVNAGDRRPAAALLLWSIEPTPGAPRVVYIPDLIWDPEAGIRNAGRYLLQELYLRHRDALAVVDMVPTSSPLNRVLMALGYRVYARWQDVLVPAQ